MLLVLAMILPACSKKADTEVSNTMPDQSAATTQQAQVPDQSAPVPEAVPPPTATSATKSKPTPKSETKSTTKSTTTKTVPAAEVRSVSLATGTVFDVQLNTAVSTATSNVGDKIEGALMQPLTSSDGQVIANQGALIRGEIAELTRATKSKSKEDLASVKFSFTSIETVDGEKSLNATVTNSEGKMVAGGTGKRDALVIGGSAVLGAILGKVIGKDTKGAVIGAFGGAVLGTGAMMASKGHELEVPAGSKVSLRVEEPVTVVAK
jgi:hypothetical protein